eukprot:CAMPEP_0184371166 /NCGR_PEP_ID=MMETSP1089-20130417/163242_1 /TAXON_ID=38269 ORGANISM="Gloeochaete wittrockiana, Strain SAG46.84" /NCGR_SAMPLE_ID=MMETSP1089 /ASSEMBLY_ACC=CAM_ASM_000445 /LENGTH=334 /DNA_ID=CAMNT_0026713879 /DNA_START=164 /DNA_END=1169 /DNA_ORIENTATION=+
MSCRSDPDKLGRSTTAEQAAKGIDLSAKVAIVTGATSGIGKETARVLAHQGAHVILGCRDVKNAELVAQELIKVTKNSKVEVIPLDLASLASVDHLLSSLNIKVTKNSKVEVIPLDLASLASVRSFAEQFKSTKLPLHILIDNAGVMATPRSLTRDGFELQFGVNHLGHFLLTNLLLEQLRESAPARVVVVSSNLHEKGHINFEDIMSEKSYDRWGAYGQSKLANILFARELNRRMAGTGVTVNAVHPGFIPTDLTRNINPFAPYLFKYIVSPFLKSIPQGAATTVNVEVNPALANVGGKYFTNCQEETPAAEALNDQVAQRLWDLSEKLVGLS